MNKWLANSFSQMNALLAIVIMLGGTLIGAIVIPSNLVLGGVLGLIGGAIAAVMICGFLAVVLDMRNLLAEICHRLKVPVSPAE